MTVIVVGSGPTGVAAAWQLVSRGVSVVMLDPGAGPMRGLQLRWRGHDLWHSSVPGQWLQEHYPHFENHGDPQARWVRLQAAGGMANVWGGVVLRFAPQDFEPHPHEDPRHHWPLSYADLEPWYLRLERLLWIRGCDRDVPTLPASEVREVLDLPEAVSALAVAASIEQRSLLPLPYVDGPPTRFLPCASPRQMCWPLLRRLRRQRRFHFKQGATVTRVLPHRSQPQVQGVEYCDASGRTQYLEADAVVLAAGSLATPRILLNSRTPAYPDGLANGHGLVGTHLHDNPLSIIHAVVDQPLPYLDGSHGGLYLTRQGYDQPGAPTAFQVYSGWAARFHPNLRRPLRPAMAPVGGDPEGCAMVFSCYTTQTPITEQALSLHPTARDRDGLPLLRLSVQFGEAEIAALEQGRRMVERMLSRTGWGHQITAVEPQPPGGSVHYGGTVRMHADPRYGVLDGFNRCHDLTNLVVVDASCFTTSVEKNPTLTAMAIAMRAADFLSAN